MTAAAITNKGPSARARRNADRLSRGRAPVRRSSRPSDDAADFYRPMSKAQRDHLVRVARMYAEAHRKRGVAPLTASTLQVLRTMIYELMDWTTGALDDAYEWIAKKSGRSYQTVVTAIAELERQGVLEKMRRCRRNEDAEGPPWVQDTNAYRFDLPRKYREWWQQRRNQREAKRREREVPDDYEHAAAAADSAREAGRAEDLADEAKAAKAAWKAQELGRDVRGPGAAAYRARLEGT